MKEVGERCECLLLVGLMLNVRLHLTQRFFFTAEFLVELRELQNDLRRVAMLFQNSRETIPRLSRRIRNNRLRPEELMPRVKRALNQRRRVDFLLGRDRLL